MHLLQGSQHEAVEKTRAWLADLRTFTENPRNVDPAFLTHIVAMKKYNKLKRSLAPSKIATTSDEALAVLLLENSSERWIDSFLTPGKENKKEWSASVYSDDGMGKKARKYGGWTEEGLKRYKTLNEEVFKKMRNTRGYAEFEKMFEARVVEEEVQARLLKGKKILVAMPTEPKEPEPDYAGDDLSVDGDFEEHWRSANGIFAV